DRIAFVEGQNVRALRADGLLYLQRGDGRLLVHGKRQIVDEELYNARADPGQHHDLARERPDLLARMRALFRREAPVPPEVPEIDGPLEGARLARLDARRAPEAGTRGDVLLWRDPGAAAVEEPLAAAGASSEASEVRGMMERWGYAQPTPQRRE